MIDLHSHILPGLDDGAPTLAASLAMAARAEREGITTIVATPHVNSQYDPDPADVAARVSALNADLREAGLALEVVAGAEVALTRIGEIGVSDLAPYCIGAGPWILVESPYHRAIPFLETALSELLATGLRPLLAHPERAPAFQAEPERVGRIVELGVATAINATSLTARRRSPVRALAVRVLAEGWAHALCSDSHDSDRRPPALLAGVEAAGIGDGERRWMTESVPTAILLGAGLPPRPPGVKAPGRRFSRS